MSATIATLSPLKFNTTVQIDGMVNINTDFAIQYARLGSDGQHAPTKGFVMAQEPMITGTSMDLATLLALNSNDFGWKGIPLSAAFNCYQAQFAADGILSTTGDKIAISNGLFLPQSLSAPHNQVATMETACLSRSPDGTTNPISVTADQTPDVGGVPTCFTLGRIERNGTALEGVQQLSIAFNITAQVTGGDGMPYPTDIRVIDASPVFTITTKDADSLADFTVDGTAQDATDTEIYLQKLNPNGTRVAAGTAEHIKFSIDDGFMRPVNWAAAHGSQGLLSLVYEPIWDESSDIIVVSTTSAIA